MSELVQRLLCRLGWHHTLPYGGVICIHCGQVRRG